MKPFKSCLMATFFLAMAGNAAATNYDYDYDYWTDGGNKPAWMPTSIKTDGHKTYIKFPDASLLAAPKPGETDRVPVLQVLQPNGGDPAVMVNYRVIGDQYEVDAVIEKAVIFGPTRDVNDRVLILHKGAKP